MNISASYRKIENHTVPILDARVRLSDYYKPGIFTIIASRKAMKNALKEGRVYKDGKRAFTSDYIQGGELVEVYVKDEVKSRPTVSITLQILYEDDYLAIVNKPAGIVVSGNKRWTLENALSGNLKVSSQPDALTYPEPIHRLDYPTTGALLIGKTSKAVILLNQLFEAKEVAKTYTAATIGKMEASGKVDTDIDEKASLSEYKVLHTLTSERYGYINLVALIPHTGRRHQLRKHMAEIGNPIFGDLDYGTDGLILKGHGVYLHAHTMAFIHPFTKEKIGIEAPYSKKFLQLFPDLLSD